MTTWIHRFDRPASAPAGRIRVAVKDAIDVAGVITTAGCVAVRDRAVPASADAACLAGLRAAGADLVGKTTLTELCLSPAGLNPDFGTPINPAAPHRIPGGSSSGSAAAVASGEADIGLGTDTGGSVRIPAACCAVVGLKTTWGRIPTTGVWPLARSLDTVGPLARTVGELVTAMRLITPDWKPAPLPARHVGRLRITGVDPAVEDLIDAALDTAGLTVRTVHLPGWDATDEAFAAIILGELWQAHHALLDVDGMSSAATDDLRAGRAVSNERISLAMATRTHWQAEVATVLADVDVLALPTLVTSPPLLSDFAGFPLTQLTKPFNLAGVPALAMPVPSPGYPVPVSLQLVGPNNGEELLCATAQAIQTALKQPIATA
jgi:amidase